MYYDVKASGLRIQQSRKAAGFTLEELSDRLNVSDRQLRRIEKGDSSGSVDLLVEISYTQRIIADKTSEDARDRVFRCNFTLKPLRYSSSSTYYLMIVNEQEKIEAKKEAFAIAIALADDDDDGFDF